MQARALCSPLLCHAALPSMLCSPARCSLRSISRHPPARLATGGRHRDASDAAVCPFAPHRDRGSSSSSRSRRRRTRSTRTPRGSSPRRSGGSARASWWGRRRWARRWRAGRGRRARWCSCHRPRWRQRLRRHRLRRRGAAGRKAGRMKRIQANAVGGRPPVAACAAILMHRGNSCSNNRRVQNRSAAATDAPAGTTSLSRPAARRAPARQETHTPLGARASSETHLHLA